MRAKLKEGIRLFSFIISCSVRSFLANGNLQRSASLAYYSLFAIFPLMMVIFLLLGFVFSSSKDVVERVLETISGFGPWLTEILKNEIFSVASRRGVIGALGIVTLIWAVMPLMGAIRRTFLEIYRISERPSFLKAKLMDMIAIVLALIALVGFSVGGLALKTLKERALYLPISFTLTSGILFVFYRAFSPRVVPSRYVVEGSLVSALLWWALGPAFRSFIKYNPNYGVAFGSFKALFLGALWLYLSFGVLLFGVEVISNRRRRDVLLLRRVFSGITLEKEEQLIKRFGRSFGPNQIIFKEGEKGSEMFYIMRGEVVLSIQGREIARLSQGNHFGEMALLIETERTAEAVAGPDGALLLSINPENFETLLREESSIAMIFLRELANRLKEMNKSVF